MLTSSFDTAKGHESFYHGFTLGMTATLLDRFRIRSNHESGYGRYDIAAFPKHAGDAGMVIECKAEETADALETKAEEALTQIEEKDYLAASRWCINTASRSAGKRCALRSGNADCYFSMGMI